jgi:dihydrodipicolinate synthase/N-acetylneuraminate lyase
MSPIEHIIERIQPKRKVEGVAAALLPFEPDGRIAVEAFQRHLEATHLAGLTNAVNMDTGYVNYLSSAERRQVLEWTRDALGPHTSFIAGVYIEDTEGDLVSLYRQEMGQVVSIGAIPILFQASRMHSQTTREKVVTYEKICKGFPAVLGFELSPVFAPNGEIFHEDAFRGLMEISELKGMKHSSLDRALELRRLELRDAHRPDFRIYTGNDLGINMIEYGSDYLLGLATFAPEKFAERDSYWAAGDARYYALSDALQHLGNVAFRAPVPAYKHSAAIFLHLCGRIPSPLSHARNLKRPVWEADILRECATRLLEVA